MPYFHTGLEPLLEKIALNVGPSTAIHPEAMHPQHAARVQARASTQPSQGPFNLHGLGGTLPEHLQSHPEAQDPRYLARMTRHNAQGMPSAGRGPTPEGPIQLPGQVAKPPEAAPGYKLSPEEEAHAAKLKTMSPEQRRSALGLSRDQDAASLGITPEMVASAGKPTPAAPTPPGVLQRFGHGAKRFGKGLGYGLAGTALLAGGAGAWALNKQKEEDDQRRGVAWAPMQGTPGTSYAGPGYGG